MREKFESEAWYYEVGSSSGKSLSGNIQGKEAAGEMSSKGKLHREFLKNDQKAKGRSRGEDLTRCGEKENCQGGTTLGWGVPLGDRTGKANPNGFWTHESSEVSLSPSSPDIRSSSRISFANSL